MIATFEAALVEIRQPNSFILKLCALVTRYPPYLVLDFDVGGYWPEGAFAALLEHFIIN